MARVAAESCGPEPDSELARARAGHLRQPRNLANEMSVGGKLGLMTDRLGEYLEPIYSMASVVKFHNKIICAARKKIQNKCPNKAEPSDYLRALHELTKYVINLPS